MEYCSPAEKFLVFKSLNPAILGLRRCQQLMYVFPVLRWLKVFSQTWEGDVTMVLPSSYMQLKKSITNPSNKDLLDACKQVCCLPLSPRL